jgi:hypothetical protein
MSFAVALPADRLVRGLMRAGFDKLVGGICLHAGLLVR